MTTSRAVIFILSDSGLWSKSNWKSEWFYEDSMHALFISVLLSLLSCRSLWRFSKVVYSPSLYTASLSTRQIRWFVRRTHSVRVRPSVLPSLLFSPAVVSPPYGNSHSRNSTTPRDYSVKRIFALPISWKSLLEFLGGKKPRTKRFFAAAHAQMAASLPNAKGNRKSKTIVYYGDV